MRRPRLARVSDHVPTAGSVLSDFTLMLRAAPSMLTLLLVTHEVNRRASGGSPTLASPLGTHPLFGYGTHRLTPLSAGILGGGSSGQLPAERLVSTWAMPNNAVLGRVTELD